MLLFLSRNELVYETVEVSVWWILLVIMFLHRSTCVIHIVYSAFPIQYNAYCLLFRFKSSHPYLLIHLFCEYSIWKFGVTCWQIKRRHHAPCRPSTYIYAWYFDGWSCRTHKHGVCLLGGGCTVFNYCHTQATFAVDRHFIRHNAAVR